MIGHKADLEDKREVSTKEGIQKAKRMGCSFFETSAKTGQNIEETMTEIVRVLKSFETPIIYITGNDISKFIQYLHKKEFSKYEIPSINKNMKNIWLNIFGFLMNSKENKLNLKLVCKYWYNLFYQIPSESKNFNYK